MYTYSINAGSNKKFLRLAYTLRISLTWDKFSNNVCSNLLQNTLDPWTGKICTFCKICANRHESSVSFATDEFNSSCTYLSPLWSILFSDGDVILVELPVLTTGLDLEGDLVKLVTLFSVDLVRVGVVVALWVDSASFFLCNYLRM